MDDGAEHAPLLETELQGRGAGAARHAGEEEAGLGEPGATHPSADGISFQEWWDVASPYWREPETRRSAYALLGLLLLMSGGGSGLLLWFSFAQRNMHTALSERSRDDFYASIRHERARPARRGTLACGTRLPPAAETGATHQRP